MRTGFDFFCFCLHRASDMTEDQNEAGSRYCSTWMYRSRFQWTQAYPDVFFDLLLVQLVPLEISTRATSDFATQTRYTSSATNFVLKPCVLSVAVAPYCHVILLNLCCAYSCHLEMFSFVWSPKRTVAISKGRARERPRIALLTPRNTRIGRNTSKKMGNFTGKRLRYLCIFS